MYIENYQLIQGDINVYTSGNKIGIQTIASPEVVYHF